MKRLIIKLLKKLKRKQPDLKKSSEISKSSTVKELLESDIDITLLLELISPSNHLFGLDQPKITNLKFQQVHDILNHCSTGDILKIVELYTGEKIVDILSLNSQDFIRFVKWMNKQIENVNKIYKSLQSEEFDKSDMAYKNAGSEKLDKYKEKIVYYSIDRNPDSWDRIGEQPFNKVFTMMMIDKDMKDINKQYAKLMKANG